MPGHPPVHDLPDVRLLRLFDQLYATRSVTRTADVLGQTQPTVSLGLKRLRRQLGDALFVRTAGGMQPTPRADALIGPTRAALEQLETLVARGPGFDPASAARKFRVLMTDASHVTLLPRLLSRLREVAPGVRLEAAAIGADAARDLAAGDGDLALGLVPGLEGGFYQQTLYRQDWVCLAQQGHPRIGARLTLRDFRREAHIHIVSGTGAHLLEAALKAHRIERRVVLEMPGFLGLTAMLAATDLVATLPRMIGETIAALGGLAVHDCPLRIAAFTVKQHWHARYHQDAANRWLRGVCADLFLDRGAVGRAA